MKNRHMFQWLWILIVFGGILFSGCNQKKFRVVARVGNHLITQDDFERNFIKTEPIYLLKNPSYQDKESHLKKMLKNRLQMQYASMLGLDKDPEIQVRIDEQRRRIAYFAALDEAVVFNVIKEAEIREFYNQSRYEVRGRQILLRLPKDTTEAQVDSVMSLAKNIIEQLKNGADFAELVKKYSQDARSARREGDMGFVRWGDMDPDFLRVLFRLGKYELAPEPVRSSMGIHIVQATDRKKVMRRPFEIERETIIQKLFRFHQKELLDRYKVYNKELDRKYDVVYHPENYEKIVQYLSDRKVDSLIAKTSSSVIKDFSWVDPDIRDLSLATYRGGKITIVDLLNLLTSQGAPAPVRTTELVKRVVEDALHIRLSTEIGLKKGFLNKEPYKTQFENEVMRILSSKLRLQEIEQKIEITEEKLHEYYINNKQKFKIPAKAEVQEILVEDEALAKKIVKWAKAGQDFTKLAEKYNTRSSTKNKKGMLGKLTKNSYGIIGKNALEMKVGEIRGPLRTGKRFSVIKVLSKEEERIQSFEEARQRVISNLRSQLRKQLEEELNQRMLHSIPVRIFEEQVAAALGEFRNI